MSWTPNFGYIGDGFNYLAGGVKNYNNYVGPRLVDQVTGGDPDWIPGVSVSGGARSPEPGKVIGATARTNYLGGPAGTDVGVQNDPTGVNNVNRSPAQQTFTDPTGRTWGSRSEYQANANNVRRDVGVKQGGHESEGRSTAAGNRLAYNNDSQDFVTGQRTGQNTINSGRVNNALNLRRSMSAIASGVRQGMRSGAVNLANMNAMDSGAAEAMARALARQGNQQAGTVNNEAQIAENTFQTDQNNLGIQRQQGLGRLKSWRDTKVNEISTKLWQNLSELDAQAQGQGVGGAVDMGIRDRVVGDASRQLDEVDAVTQQELAKIGGLDYNGVQAQVSQMEQAGQEVANPFTYEGGGLQVGNGGTTNTGGAVLGPLGTAPKHKDEQSQLIPSAWVKDDKTVTA
jgi:hypothetical protein